MKVFRNQFYHPLLVLVWIIVGLALRFHNISLKSLWADECSTLVFSLGHSFRTVPLDELISAEQLLSPLMWTSDSNVLQAVQTLLTESNHPPLFFGFTHSWLDFWQFWSEKGGFVLGQSIEDIPLTSVRLLSALFGVLAIPVTYLSARWLWRSPSSNGTPYSLVHSSANISAHISALLMALSPFGIYLAQEARHYTLTILWILGSLSCLVAVLRYWRDRRPIPLWLIVSWIGLNGLGLATHYFFGLTLVAEAVVLMVGVFILARFRGQHQQTPQLKQNYGRLGAIALGTMASGAVWLPFLLAIQQGDELTRWIQSPAGGGLSWLSPLQNTLASLVTMLYLLPIQGVGAGVAIASGVVITGATIITFIRLKCSIIDSDRGIGDAVPPVKMGRNTLGILGVSTVLGWLRDHSMANMTQNPQEVVGEDQIITEGSQAMSDETLSLFVLVGVAMSAIAIMLMVTYGFGMDISQAFRYHFVYFPAVILVMGRGLAHLWLEIDPQNLELPLSSPEARKSHSGRQARRRAAGWQSRLWVGGVLTLALCGALTVANNLAYQKIHHPDRVVNSMANRSNYPIIVAISHQSHGQTGRLMSLAWEMKRQAPLMGIRSKIFNTAQFFLDHQPCHQAGEQNCNTPSAALRQTLKTLNDSYDLWLINYEGQTKLKNNDVRIVKQNGWMATKRNIIPVSEKNEIHWGKYRSNVGELLTMHSLFGILLLIIYVGGVWKFWTGFSRTNFNQGKWYLGALWPILLINASYRQNFSKALKGR